MKITENHYTPIQLKLPVYSFADVLNHIDLKKYIVEKDYSTGRHGYDLEKLLKITLFAFMEYGYVSLREIEKLCKTDIREEYAIEYLESVRKQYLEITGLKPENFVYGRGKHKTPEQRYYEFLRIDFLRPVLHIFEYALVILR